MPDNPLRRATPDEIAAALSFAPHYDGRKRVHQADDMMASWQIEPGLSNRSPIDALS